MIDAVFAFVLQLFQYIGGVVLALTTAGIVTGIFGCQYMLKYFMFAWLPIDILCVTLLYSALGHR